MGESHDAPDRSSHVSGARREEPDGEDAYRETIDWDRYWEGFDDADRENVDANPSARYVRDPLLGFLEGRDALESYADVGCGPGTIPFAVADRYREATVVGYDAAQPILRENRERARKRDHENLRFERTVLPSFDPDREYDVVSAFFTLCYVEETERALRNLYDAVAPGGTLVFTYHNRFARAYYGRAVEAPAKYFDASFPTDPERFYERFRLVIEGESLLSYERIHDALGTWPQSLWSSVEASERYGAWRSIPLVFVPKC